MNEDLYYDIHEKIDNALDNFCDGCDAAKIDQEPLDWTGRPIFKQERICEPGGSRCSRKKEYENVCRLQAVVRGVEREVA